MPSPISIISGIVLGLSSAEVYRFAGNDPKVRQIVITSMGFVNNDSVARKVTVYVIPDKGAASFATTKILAMSIPSSTGGGAPTFIVMDETLLPGHSIQAFADTAAVVAFRANGTAYP